MRHSIAIRRVLPVFGILVLALAVAYVWTHPSAQLVEQDQTAAAEPVVGDDGSADGQSPSPPMAFPPLDEYHEIVARPLFSNTRRPPEVQVAAPKKKPPAKPGKETYVLTGVLVTPNRRVAILKPAGGGNALRVSEGGNIDGWRVASVKARSVLLKQGAQRQELKLQVITKKAAKGAPKRSTAARPKRRAERRRSSRRDSGSQEVPNPPYMPAANGGAK